MNNPIRMTLTVLTVKNGDTIILLAISCERDETTNFETTLLISGEIK